jgi:hypothetical protein
MYFFCHFVRSDISVAETGEWVQPNEKILTIQIEDEIEEISSPEGGIITETCLNEEELVSPGRTLFSVDVNAQNNLDMATQNIREKEAAMPSENFGPSS